MKTKSELLFEGYLKAHGITDWDYEPDIEGKSKKIDYFLDFKNQHIVCDVKECMMIDYDRMEPENTTISAIVTLGRVPVGHRRLSIETKRIEKALGRSLTWGEHWEFIHSEPSSQWISVRKKFDLRTKVLRVVVHENPFARKPLTRELFRGPYDERFGPVGDHMACLYTGEGIQKLEQEEASVGKENGEES